MSFLRIKTVKGKQYLYRQTSVSEGKKVRSIMEYLGSFGGHYETAGRSVPNRNADLQSTQNPKRPNYTDEHRRGLFKTNKAEFNRLQAFDAARAKSSKEDKAAWKEKNMSRGEKKERAEAKQASDTKAKETMEAIKEFNEARAQEKEQDG
jgi:hypothetical protein